MSARVFPSDLNNLALEGLALREHETLQNLVKQLPDDYTIYHGVHWTRLEQGFTVAGRVQYLILSPNGLLSMVVMKTGLMRLEQGRVYKQLGENRLDVFNELLNQRDVLESKFKRQTHHTLVIEAFFYCPDFVVPDSMGLAVDHQRIVDAGQKDKLADILVTLAEQYSPHCARLSLNNPLPPAQLVHQFLSNELNLVPEVGALSAATETWVTRLSQGLEQWVARLHFEPFRLRITGTAGSGKSQLALRELHQNHAGKLRTLYVCYNRPLASHVGNQARQAELKGVSVYNFHALCDKILRDSNVVLDYSQPGFFDTLADKVLELPLDKHWVFDSIVVDEGQDFDARWLQVLERFSHAQTRWLWLEDPDQNLYNKPVVTLPRWVGLTVPVNYRNPQRIVHALEQFKTKFEPHQNEHMQIEAGCPLEGLPLEYLEYETSQELFTQTSKAITLCLKHGFSRDNIVIISMSGHEKSRVLKQAGLGPHTLRHFTGSYDEHGVQVFTEGSVLAESVYRFKGQSAQAVVITEIEFDTFGLQNYRKLFVAMTRAKMFLALVGQGKTLSRLLS